MKLPCENSIWHKDELHYVNCDLCGAEHTIPVTIRPDGMNVVETSQGYTGGGSNQIPKESRHG